jgi:7-carboxy-7-deazaguanine synthase
MNNLNLIEIFASVQGETSLSGLPTTFVRLAACNLRCTWCDTPYSFVKGTSWTLEAIQTQVQKYSCSYVCITGGEPLLQKNVYRLMSNLCDAGYRLSLETGGSLSTEHVDARVRIILDIKCPGSAMSHKNDWSNLSRIRSHDEIKFVIKDETDYLFAQKVCSDYSLFNKTPHILFSPVHGILEPKCLVEWILRDYLPIRLNLQIHKYIWDPQTRGV